MAVPEVVAQRLTRMALAGPRPSKRDQREAVLMGAEKIWAWYESWLATSTALMSANQRVMTTMLTAPFSLGGAHKARSERTQSGPFAILSAAMAPYHRRAVANARRLRRRRK